MYVFMCSLIYNCLFDYCPRLFVKISGSTSERLACITLDVMPADTTVECILDYISETGRDMHECQKVSTLF